MSFLRPEVIIGALPVTLANGTTADATQVMSDLNWIVNQVNANAAPLATTALTNVNNNFTAVQSGLAATAAANFPIASQVQQNVFNTLSSTLGTNTITARCAALAISSYSVGQPLYFIPSQTNTGPATLAADTAPATPILWQGQALAGGELRQGVQAEVVPDGSALQLIANGGACVPYGLGTSLAVGATVNLNLANGDYPTLTGTGTITALTLAPGKQVTARFASSAVLTHSATLPLLGSANMRTAVNDLITFRGEPDGVTRMVARSVNANALTSSLTADVACNNTALYFDGPTVNVGNAGTWLVSGTVSLKSGTTEQFFLKLWDGTTVIDSTVQTTITSNDTTASLSGIITNPAGPLRISARGTIRTDSLITFNATGNSKDSTISAVRVG